MEGEWLALATKLSADGHGVIVTDRGGRVVFLSPEAERLTGWENNKAEGQPLASITRRRAGAALQEAIELRQLALDAAEMGTWEVDPQSLLCTVDKRCQSLLGVLQPTFTYAQFLDLLHPDDRERVNRANLASHAPGSDGRYDCEYRVVRADGTVRWVAAKGQTVFEGEGDLRRAVRVIGTVMDITPRKNIETALREAVGLRQIALDIAELGTWDSAPQDPGGLSCMGDARCQAILGVPGSPHHHTVFLNSVYPDDRQHVDQAAAEALAPGSEGRYSVEYRLVLADGSVRWVAAKGMTFFEGEGESRHAVRGIGTVMDITARKEAENALREAAELRQLALDAAEMGTWEHDPQTHRCVVDDRCRVILGLPGERFHYEAFLNVLHPEDRERVDAAHQMACDPASDGHYGAEYRVVWADGSVHWVAAKGRVSFEGEGASRHAVRLVGMVMDITPRKDIETALREAVELRQLAMDIAGLGTWDAAPQDAAPQDPSGVSYTADARCQAILGVPATRYHHTLFMNRVHPDDRQHVDQAAAGALAPDSGGRYNAEYRVMLPDGSVRWVAAKGIAFFEGQGESRHAVRGIGTVMDITASRLAEEELRANEELLRQSVRVSGLGIFDYNHLTDTLQWSPRLHEMRGYPLDRQPSIAALLECIHPDDRQKVIDAMDRSSDPHGDGLYFVENRMLWPDGTVRWLNERGQTFFEGEGPARRPVRSVGVVIDITDRKLAEERLGASEEFLQQAVRVSELGVFDYDHRTHISLWSPKLREIRGFGPDEPVSIPLYLECVHPEDRQKVADAVARTTDPNGDGVYLVENRILWPDGSVRWTSNRGQTFFEGEGAARHAVRTVGAVRDITERKRAEEKLRASEELFRAFFDNLAVGTAQVDLEGRFLQVNDRYCQITGYRREELLTMHRWDVIHPDDWPADQERLAWFHQGHPPTCEMEERYVRKDGSVIWVQVNRSLIRDSEGRPLRVAGIVQDITARKQAEEALAAARRSAEQAQAAAEAANQAKSQFLAHMSHELRTPMNSILGMTELALQEPLAPMVRESLQTVKDSADSLLVLINEVLDLSRIEAGALALESDPFCVRALLDDTLRAISVRAFEKGLELACHVASDVPDRLVGDPLRLRQILTNLLGNAIKFTEHGEVVVRVDTVIATPIEVRLRFAVTDTGIGIAPEHQQRIFAPFIQADPSMTRRFGGTGLGLSIVSRLVDMMGGQIGLESQPGHGSTFSVTLTLRRQDGPEPVDPQVAILRKFHDQPVLVADRHAVNRRILEEILSGWSMRPVLAHDVTSVLAQLHATAHGGQDFPLMILDASMPGIERLRLRNPFQPGSPIATAVVLTVWPAERMRLDGLPDATAFLEKPITPPAVASALVRATGDAAQTRHPPVSTAGPAAPRPLRILLAEDTPANQRLAVRILSRRGHLVEVAQDGQEALQKLCRDSFDVVLMDVQMPVMDGFQATREIRKLASPDIAHVPVIAMTAHALKGDQERCLAAGMDAYISKPINSQELIALVERVLVEKCR